MFKTPTHSPDRNSDGEFARSDRYWAWEERRSWEGKGVGDEGRKNVRGWKIDER